MLENAAGSLAAMACEPVRPSPTRLWEVTGLEELSSELISREHGCSMLRPHLGSREARIVGGVSELASLSYSAHD